MWCLPWVSIGITFNTHSLFLIRIFIRKQFKWGVNNCDVTPSLEVDVSALCACATHGTTMELNVLNEIFMKLNTSWSVWSFVHHDITILTLLNKTRLGVVMVMVGASAVTSQCGRLSAKSNQTLKWFVLLLPCLTLNIQKRESTENTSSIASRRRKFLLNYPANRGKKNHVMKMTSLGLKFSCKWRHFSQSISCLCESKICRCLSYLFARTLDVAVPPRALDLVKNSTKITTEHTCVQRNTWNK